MEIDFRTAREALIYDIGIKTGMMQREAELQQQTTTAESQYKASFAPSPLIINLQQKVDFTINVIKGL